MNTEAAEGLGHTSAKDMIASRRIHTSHIVPHLRLRTDFR
jgi:hypothetical protein